MKCTRCGQTMARKQESFNKYYYECLRCHKVIRANKKETKKEESQADAE